MPRPTTPLYTHSNGVRSVRPESAAPRFDPASGPMDMSNPAWAAYVRDVNQSRQEDAAWQTEAAKPGTLEKWAPRVATMAVGGLFGAAAAPAIMGAMGGGAAAGGGSAAGSAPAFATAGMAPMSTAGAAGVAGAGAGASMSMSPFTSAAMINSGASIAGNVIAGIGQGKQAEADREQRIRELLALQAQYEQTRSDNMGKVGLETANATPNRVAWRQNQAVMNAMMPGMRNFEVQAPAGMEAYVPQTSGGLRIPEGGFSPETLKFFSDSAMLAGEEDLDMAGAVASSGRQSTPNYAAAYGGNGSNASSRVSTASAALRAQDEANARRRQQAMTGALSTGSRR